MAIQLPSIQCWLNGFLAATVQPCHRNGDLPVFYMMPEYVIGDMITPFKAALGTDYKKIEKRLEEAVHIRFGLPAILPQKNRVCD